MRNPLSGLVTLVLAIAVLTSVTACGGGGGTSGESSSPISPSPSVSSAEREAQALEEYIAAVDAAFAPVGDAMIPYGRALRTAFEAIERNDAAAFEKARTPIAEAVADLRNAFRDSRREMQSIPPPPKLRAAHKREMESLHISERFLGELHAYLLSLDLPVPDLERHLNELEEDWGSAARRAEQGTDKWLTTLYLEAERLDVWIPGESLTRAAFP